MTREEFYAVVQSVRNQYGSTVFPADFDERLGEVLLPPIERAQDLVLKWREHANNFRERAMEATVAHWSSGIWCEPSERIQEVTMAAAIVCDEHANEVESALYVPT